MMSEFDMQVAGEIMEWAFENYKGIEDISHKLMVDTYWEEYFATCEMSTPETGLEMPHENEYFSDINIWTGGVGIANAS